MKTASPLLLPLLRSRAQGDVIAWIFLHPDNEHSLIEIAQHVGVSPATVMREVDRLAEAGLVVETRRGSSRMVRADQANTVFAPLADLMAVTFGPVPVLTDELADVDGIEQAFIYGSYAERYRGQAGPVPNDIDVLVVGTADRAELFDLAERLSRKLGREVNIRRVTPEAWNDTDSRDPFLTTVRSRPIVELNVAARSSS